VPLLGGNISVYRRVVAASGLANLGDGVRQVALPLLAAAITQDAALVAGLTAIAYVPWMLLGLPIGALVDRSRPELFVLGAAVARGVLFGVLTLTLARWPAAGSPRRWTCARHCGSADWPWS